MPDKKQRGYKTSDEIHIALKMEALQSGETINDALERILRQVLISVTRDSNATTEDRRDHKPPVKLAAVADTPEVPERDQEFNPSPRFGNDDADVFAAHWEAYIPGDDEPWGEGTSKDDAIEAAVRLFEASPGVTEYETVEEFKTALILKPGEF